MGINRLIQCGYSTPQQRHGLLIELSLGVSVLMMGCSPPAPVPPPPEPSSEVVQQVTTGAQSLPIAATVKVGQQIIQLEVAKTPDQQSTGLMFRPTVADDRGMLFPFNPPRPVNFWMKNVLVNLDMVFLRSGKVIAIASNVPPCKTEPCPTYGPDAEIDQVIELRGKRAKELGIKVGDQLIVEPIN